VVIRDDGKLSAERKSRFFHIYPHVKNDINERAEEKKPLPDLVKNAYALLGKDWLETAKLWGEQGFPTPPVMITVANRTETAARIKHAFDRNRFQIEELCDPEHTIHIDSKVLAKGEGFTLPADTVLTAIGEAIEPDAVPPEVGWRASSVGVDDWGRTSLPNVFAGGDITETPRTVAHALGAGKRAAIGIDRYLRARSGETLEATLAVDALRFGPSGNVSMARWRLDDPVARVDPINEVTRFEDLNPSSFARVARQEDRHLDGGQGWAGFTEVNRGLTREMALAEAGRCFNCGVCNQCDLCLILCPDVAISRSNGHYEIALDYCKGCGICAEECPRSAVTMAR